MRRAMLTLLPAHDKPGVWVPVYTDCLQLHSCCLKGSRQKYTVQHASSLNAGRMDAHPLEKNNKLNHHQQQRLSRSDHYACDTSHSKHKNQRMLMSG